MTNPLYSVSIHLEITDPAELWDAAVAHAREERGEYWRPSDVEEFGTKEEPNIHNCLRQLADPGISWPGTEIRDSSAEEHEPL